MPYSSLFRSEEMSLIQLYIPQETAQPTVAELGELGLIQFRDLNPDVNAFQRAFVKEIRRFDEMERHLRFFDAQLTKSDIPVRPLTGDIRNIHARSAQEIDDLEEKIIEHERRITQMNDSYETLQKQYLKLTEMKFVLQETRVFFDEATSRQDNIRNSFDEPTAPLLEQQDLEHGSESLVLHHLNLGFVTGVISRAKMLTFERILWRALRGNLYLKYVEIDEPITDPETDEVLEKNVFIIFAHGKELINKITKISESLGATLYPVDSDPNVRDNNSTEITSQIEARNSVLQNTYNVRRTELLKIAEDLNIWMTIIKKEKAIYHTMNLFNYDSGRKCLIAEGWCPSNDFDKINQALRNATDQSGSTVPSILNELRTTKEPPTFIRVNKFTVGFQEIVDAYGVAKYREVNPGLFTIITFPFLFAVMFGDFGHGMLVTAAALYLVIREKKFEKGISDEWHGNQTDAQQIGVYPIGIDPAWHGSDNFLIFTNSYKMKMSIILGVIQRDNNGELVHSAPPGLLNMLIYMFLQPGVVAEEDKLYPGQGFVQGTLLFIALICVPWMLLTKPFIMRRDHKKIRSQGYHNPQMDTTRVSTDEDNEYGGAVVAEEMFEVEEFDFGEIMIHQCIHTIEFCLGCISNTASYLRLWALSLAHAQLSSVLWDMTLKPTLGMSGVLGTIAFIIAFTLWFSLTVFILLLMEGLSAFLHALRLHWVEFNNKFYEGTGRKFQPFSFKLILKDDDH
ncbi:43209_t:CDS:10 [Gigaspora margarita]|uniref:V-type proton ATPase subunit a n=1 Tax=Gigaspora margarita TaxID=4874 RepID=A0ABM8W2K1_GIGMA|nr:43209_t:CDS:10 [Gigaspora margarita]